MTNQEAIELIKVAQAEVEWSCPMDYAVAFDLAIKALEQEPCEDCISRQAAIEAMGEQPLNWTDSSREIAEEMMWEDHVKALKELPTVTPKTEPCEDCISRQAVVDWLTERTEKYDEKGHFISKELVKAEVKNWLAELPPVTPARPKSKWIPVKWHEITEKERVIEEYPNEWLLHLDCILPEDDEEILITTKSGYVEKDTAYCDDGCYLDSGYDWVEDVIAWMPLPEPYKAESEG